MAVDVLRVSELTGLLWIMGSNRLTMGKSTQVSTDRGASVQKRLEFRRSFRAKYALR